MSTDSDDLVMRLQSEYGAALRAVATYTNDDYEIHYARADVENHYSVADKDTIYNDVVLQDAEHLFHEALFDDMGQVRGKVRLFEDGTVAHFWPTDAEEGVFVATDSSTDLDVRELLGIAREFYA
jgi:hypothetical protein